MRRAEGPEPALVKFQLALKAYREAGDPEGAAIVLGHLGTCYKNLNDLQRALEFHQQALEQKQALGLELEVAKTRNGLGLVYWQLGDYELAAQNFNAGVEIARALDEPAIEAAIINNLALVYDEWGEYRKSLQTYERALEMHRQSGNLEYQSDTLGNIGGVHLLLGHFGTALDYYRQALSLSRQLGLRPSEAIDLGNMAICYLHLGNTEEALETLEEALTLARETGRRTDQAYWHGGKGSALSRLGRYEEALEEFGKAFEIYQEAQAKREIIETLGQIGSVELLLGDVSSSEARFDQALQLARSANHNREITNSLNALGENARLSGRLARAESLFKESLAYSTEIGDQANQTTSLLNLAAVQLSRSDAAGALESASRASSIAEEIGARPRQAMALKLKADAELEQGNASLALRSYASGIRLAESIGDPELKWQLAHARALALLELDRKPDAVLALGEAIQILETARFQLDSRRHQAGFLDRRYQPYLDLIRVLVDTNQERNGFLIAERLRATQLLREIDESQPFPGEADNPKARELRNRLRYLRSLIREEQQKPVQEQRAPAVAIYQAELASVEADYRQLSTTPPPDSNPKAYFQGLAVPQVEEIQSRLPQGSALLNFVQAEDELFIFCLTPTRLEAVRLPESEQSMSTRIEILLELVALRQGEEWRAPARSLQDLLFGPLRKAGLLTNVTRLYLVPHSNLHYLPFAALVSSRPGEESRVLIDDYSITYLPSASQLTRDRSRPQATKRLLAMAPKSAGLEFVEEEVERVAENFPDKSRLLTGSAASEAALKAHPAEFRFIHLATHAQFDKLNPLRSALVLEAGDGEDGHLQVREILEMEIQAELVTLSACETALGGGFFKSVPPGDDFVGLTQAFLEAGSESVLATLWRVDDRSTMDLMTAFYQQVAAREPTLSLVAAQQQIRSQPDREHPYYWAPFVLVRGSAENRGERLTRLSRGREAGPAKKFF